MYGPKLIHCLHLNLIESRNTILCKLVPCLEQSERIAHTKRTELRRVTVATCVVMVKTSSISEGQQDSSPLMQGWTFYPLTSPEDGRRSCSFDFSNIMQHRNHIREVALSLTTVPSPQPKIQRPSLLNAWDQKRRNPKAQPLLVDSSSSFLLSCL